MIILAVIVIFAAIFFRVLRLETSNIADIIQQTEGTGTINIIMIWIQKTVFILVPLITWKYIMKRSLSSMGLNSLKSHGRELLVGLLLGAVSISAVFGILVLSGQATVASWTPRFSTDTITYLLIFIAVGFSEEIYGRGFVMATLRRTKSVTAAILISAVIFSLLHLANPGMGIVPFLKIFLVGILFAYMFLLSGNIWMCIGYHITWNYFQGNVFGFLVSGNASKGLLTTVIEKDNIINGGNFGPEGGLAVTFIILVGFLFVKYCYRNKNYTFINDTLFQ